MIAKNIKRRPNARVAFTRDVTLHLGDSVYSLLSRREVRINGSIANLPVALSDGVSISSSGIVVVSVLSPCVSFQTDSGNQWAYICANLLHSFVTRVELVHKLAGACVHN